MNNQQIQARVSQLIDDLDQEIELYNNSEDENPPASFWDTLETLIDEAAGYDVPANCREVFDEIAELGNAFTNYDLDQNIGSPYEILNVAGRLIEKRKRIGVVRTRPPRESILQLFEEGVSDNQIALMWGLTNDDGSSAGWKAREEKAYLEKTGQHYWCTKERGWIDPNYVEDATREQATRERMKRLRIRRAGIKEQVREAEQAVCPESPFELFTQGVGIDQAAAMLKVNVKDAADIYQYFRIGYIPSDPENASEQWAALAATRDEAMRRSLNQDQPPADDPKDSEPDQEPDGQETPVNTSFVPPTSPATPSTQEAEDDGPIVDGEANIDEATLAFMERVETLNAEGKTIEQIAKTMSDESGRRVSKRRIQEALSLLDEASQESAE